MSHRCETTMWTLGVALVTALGCGDGGGGEGASSAADAGTGSGCCYWLDDSSHMAAADSTEECDALAGSATDIDYAQENENCADEARIPGWF